MKFLAAAALLCALAASAMAGLPTQHKLTENSDYMAKQKNLVQLLVRVHQRNMYPDQKSIGDQYDIEANSEKYEDNKIVKMFAAAYKKGRLLPRGEIFSVLKETHMKQAIMLFDLFYFAKDWDTFYKTACWARDRLNEGQFVYALHVAVMHRNDCRQFTLPPIFEIMPHLFVDASTMQQAFQARMQYAGTTNSEARTIIIPANYTRHYAHPGANLERLLAHFTEDVGLNAYNAYFHIFYPFWMMIERYGHTADRYGELFFYTRQQLLARYNLERLSAGLPEVQALSFEWPITEGYAPMLRYPNGADMPSRPDNLYLHDNSEHDLIRIKDIERRIRDAIDFGYVFTEDGSKKSIYEKDGVDLLGRLIAYSGKTTHSKYYDTLYHMLQRLVSHAADPLYKHGMAPGALEYFSTALRDPAWYRICERIDMLFRKYKKALERYSVDELSFPGVKIESIDVDKLVTFFDHFDIDLMNAVDVSSVEDSEKLRIIARTQRINYKPFTYKVNVNSDKEANVMVRVFLGPKYDAVGNEMTFENLRRYMVEIDRFPYKVTTGQTVITRNSQSSTTTMKDRSGMWSMLHQLQNVPNSHEDIYIDQIANHCGYPDRLLLPRVHKNSMPFVFFAMVTPYEGPMTLPKAFVSCGVGYDVKYPDNKSMGFPFDRVINDYYDFITPNMYIKDVLIFHKKNGDLSIHV